MAKNLILTTVNVYQHVFEIAVNYTFNLDPIRVPQKYPGKKYYRGPRKGQLSCNPLGKNPGDLWDISKVRADYVDTRDDWIQLPVHAVRRLVLAMTNRGDIVFDPFAGAASTLVAAVLLNRRAVGVNVEKRYLRVAKRRINRVVEGKLTLRDLYETKENQPAY